MQSRIHRDVLKGKLIVERLDAVRRQKGAEETFERQMSRSSGMFERKGSDFPPFFFDWRFIRGIEVG